MKTCPQRMFESSIAHLIISENNDTMSNIPNPLYQELEQEFERISKQWSIYNNGQYNTKPHLAAMDIDKRYNSLEELPPIPYFIRWLNIHNSNLTSLEIPKHLLDLNISGCTSLQELPSLPSTLTSLDISNTNISSLPVLKHLPLKRLVLSNSKITEVPELPPTLDTFVAINTPIKTLPDLPSLYSLNIKDTQVSELPSLPKGLTYLNISGTQIKSLPDELPTHLRSIYLSNTGISSLPSLIPDEVWYLHLANTKIKHLPPLPSCLGELDISNTPITEIPKIPRLTDVIYAEGCELLEIPDIPGQCKIHLGNNEVISRPLFNISSFPDDDIYIDTNYYDVWSNNEEYQETSNACI